MNFASTNTVFCCCLHQFSNRYLLPTAVTAEKKTDIYQTSLHHHMCLRKLNACSRVRLDIYNIFSASDHLQWFKRDAIYKHLSCLSNDLVACFLSFTMQFMLSSCCCCCFLFLPLFLNKYTNNESAYCVFLCVSVVFFSFSHVSALRLFSFHLLFTLNVCGWYKFSAFACA